MPLTLLVVLIILLGVVILKKYNFKSFLPFKKFTSKQELAVVPTINAPSPKPRPLTQGKETYTFSPGPLAIGPKISEFALDPMDPKKGQKQTISVKMNYTGPITSVTAKLDTDTKKTDLTFTRTDGTDLIGTWQTTRTEDDTHDYTYYLNFTLVGTPDTYNGGFAFR